MDYKNIYNIVMCELKGLINGEVFEVGNVIQKIRCLMIINEVHENKLKVCRLITADSIYECRCQWEKFTDCDFIIIDGICYYQSNYYSCIQKKNIERVYTDDEQPNKYGVTNYKFECKLLDCCSEKVWEIYDHAQYITHLNELLFRTHHNMERDLYKIIFELKELILDFDHTKIEELEDNTLIIVNGFD